VAQASFRGAIQESLENRPVLLARNVRPIPENPNAIRSTESIPSLDILETDIRARTLSGTMFVSGVEPLDGQQRARTKLRLVDADLSGLLVDLGETNTQATGRLSIQCDLQGALTSTATLEGQGQGWLRNANLYELPAMIRLFRVLSVSPGQGAFDSADFRFSIDGDKIPVQELILDGDIVSMRGSGWINMRRELHFDLFANVGRRSLLGTMIPPISRSNAAKLWQIEVNGTTTDPQIRRPMQMMGSLDRGILENDSSQQ